MANQKLVDYIKTQLQSGYDENSIRSALLEQGWDKKNINEAFSEVYSQHSSQEAVSSEGNKNQSNISVDTSVQDSGEKLPRFSELFKQAWYIYKEKLPILLGVYAAPYAAVAVLFFVLLAVEDLVTTFVLIFAGGITAALFFVLSQVAMIWAISKPDNVGIAEAYKNSKGMLLPYIWVSILTGIIVVGGFFLLLVPGIIFSIWFAFALILVVVEGERGMNALLKSKEYVKGRLGSVFLRMFVFGVLVSLVGSFIPGIVASFNEIIGTALQMILAFLITPLSLAYAFVLYRNLKQFKGSFNFSPSGKEKVLFIGLGVLGLALIPVFFFSLLYGVVTNIDFDFEPEEGLFEIENNVPVEEFEDMEGAEEIIDFE